MQDSKHFKRRITFLQDEANIMNDKADHPITRLILCVIPLCVTTQMKVERFKGSTRDTKHKDEKINQRLRTVGRKDQAKLTQQEQAPRKRKLHSTKTDMENKS